MPASKRRWTALTLSSATVLVSLLAWLGFRTEWKTLYSGLDAEDARQVGMTLTQAQIPYELSNDGLALRVPSAQLDKARLATSGKALRTGRMGFELFDKPNWMGSEFDEQVNYQRALEGELEHTVSSLADIELARVHLVMPHESLFRDEQRPAKASVVLKLRHASLAEGEADSIRNLLSSAVDGLSPDRVVLVDAAGRQPLGPKTAESLRLGAEQALEQKVLATLEPITGQGNVRASASIDYDQESMEETSESYDPTESATLSMERTEQTSEGAVIASGVPGTASNAPNSTPVPVFPKQTSTPQTSRTESGTYGVSKTVRHRVDSPGKVRRITVAVVVNDRMVAGPTKSRSAQWSSRSAEELHNLTVLAQAAVGFDNARGDLLTVQNMQFEENIVRTGQSTPIEILANLRRQPEVVKYVCLLLATVALLVFGIRPGLRQLTTLRNPVGIDKTPIATEGHQQGLQTGAPDPERLRAQEIFDKVTGQIRNEPTQTSRLLQSWIHSD
nr:flagellar basal-body MS-ring/collar protein FliF [Occallatibacter savannae]